MYKSEYVHRFDFRKKNGILDIPFQAAVLYYIEVSPVAMR